MDLVIDANELFSAIISKGKKRETKKLDVLFSPEIMLFAPALLFKELEKNFFEIQAKAGLLEPDLKLFIKVLQQRIEIVPTEELLPFLLEAKTISPHDKDIPYFAVALRLRCSLWSGDKALKGQSKIKVFNTRDLAEELEGRRGV